jgi:hypothetical protein
MSNPFSRLTGGLVDLGGSSTFSAEALAIFAAFSTPPDAARKTAIDTYVVALKSAGVWTKLDVLYAFAAADSQAALINWKNPGTFNGTLVGSPTFTADRGFTCPGLSVNYVSSNFVPSSAGGNFVQNSAHYSIRTLNDAGPNDTRRVVGNPVGTSPRTAFTPVDSSPPGSFWRINSANPINAGNATRPSDHFIINRTNSTDTQLYVSGASSGSSTVDTSTGLPTTAMVFGADPVGAGNSDFLVAGGSIGSSLNSTEAAALNAAETAYMHTVGAYPTASYIGTASATVSGSSSSASGVNIGPASADRLVVVCIGYQSGSKTVTSATIAGIAATVVQTNAVNGENTAIISANVPTGTTGTIAINYSGANTGSFDTLSVFNITGLGSFTAVSSVNGGVSAGTTMTASPTPSWGGVIITASETQFADITSTIAITTSTETFAAGANTYNGSDGRTHFSAFAQHIGQLVSPSVVTVSWTGNNNGNISSACWR